MTTPTPVKTHTPLPWEADVQYLARLADWAAGEGFCQLKDIDDPDEWCFHKWGELRPDSNGDDYSADALAASLIASIKSDTSNHADLLALAHQYASDLRHPPSADSVERRLERIAAVLAKVGA